MLSNTINPNLNETREIAKPKRKKKSNLNTTAINNMVNNLLNTSNNAQIFLNPASSTRTPSKLVKNPISLDLNIIKQAKLNNLKKSTSESNQTGQGWAFYKKK